MEKIQAGLRGVLRFLLFVVVILVFLVVGLFIHLFSREESLRQRRFSNNAHRFSKFAVWAFRFKVNVINPPSKDQNFLLVSNHMGFIDIMAVLSSMPMLFVTSQEMRETPFLGLVTEMAGCMYVERRSRSQIVNELKKIADVLKSGLRVTLYPEATSTNGEQVLPFKRTLMMAAAHAGVPIQPLVVNFKNIDGEDFNLKTRDRVCWYGDMGFLTALWSSFTLRTLTVDVEFLEQIHSTLDDDRGLIADRAHDLIAAKFKPAGADGLEITPAPTTTETV